MATNKEDLKEYFEDGDTPTEGQFGELIDSMLNLAETGTQIVAGTISASGVNAGAYSLESLDFGSVSSDITVLNLTSSLNFGSASADPITTMSFFGPIYQSSSGHPTASYFLDNVLIGTTTSSQSPYEGLTIYKDSNIGDPDLGVNYSLTQIYQQRSSSILIQNSNTK